MARGMMPLTKLYFRIATACSYTVKNDYIVMITPRGVIFRSQSLYSF